MRGDGLYRRPKSPFWYFKLKENGGWREVSTKTSHYQEARRVRQKKLDEQENGMLPDFEISRLTFERAAKEYLEAARLRLSPATVAKERFFLVRPCKTFGKVVCEKITASHIRQLQRAMKDGGCKASYNNLVFGAASRVLKFAKVWKRLESDVKRIRERAKPAGRVLTQQEESRLFYVASSRPEWAVVYAAALIAASTTCRGCELKSLKWKDVDLFNQTASIPDSKTDEGVRLVALNPDAMAGFRILLDRARLVNGERPEYYVFPACEHGHIDPTRPQKTWRTAWRSLTKRAGLQGLRFHDCRYLAVTKMGEVGAPDQVIMAQAGHVSKRMLDYYSKARLKAKREAVDAMAPILPRQPEVSTLRPN